MKIEIKFYNRNAFNLPNTERTVGKQLGGIFPEPSTSGSTSTSFD